MATTVLRVVHTYAAPWWESSSAPPGGQTDRHVLLLSFPGRHYCMFVVQEEIKNGKLARHPGAGVFL
jgi:hypothetical protein